MILQIFKFKINVTEIIFNTRLKWAIRKAERYSKEYHKKYIVISFGGKLRVYQKAALKDLIKRRKFFKKGVTVEQLEKMAYHITR